MYGSKADDDNDDDDNDDDDNDDDDNDDDDDEDDDSSMMLVIGLLPWNSFLIEDSISSF